MILVAPCVGAWIETTVNPMEETTMAVAPCVGAWIETVGTIKDRSTTLESHPAWVRGLKHAFHYRTDHRLESHPAWVRGLKLVAVLLYCIFSVAPCVGAWIETKLMQTLIRLQKSHPAWVRGLKHAFHYRTDHRLESHPAWVRGLKHCFPVIIAVS